MEDLVSIIIPAYNAEKFIGECLEKVLEQDYENIEVVVMNDGSSDSTLEIATRYSKIDSRIKVYSQENSGSSVARINGAMKSNGKYILFLDSDDFFMKDAISKLVNVAHKYDTDLIKFRLQRYPECTPQPLIIGNKEEDVVVYKEEFKEKIYPLFINTYNLNPNGTLMVKRSCFKIKDVESYYKLRFAEDLKLSLELFDNALSVTIISDVLYNYFTNYSSATKSNNIDKILYNMGNFITVYSLMYKYLEKWKIDTEENLKKLNLKVLREIATFYTKIKLSDDVEFIENNKEKIKNMIYSDIVLNAIDSVNEEDLDKNDKYYNSLIAIYKKSI